MLHSPSRTAGTERAGGCIIRRHTRPSHAGMQPSSPRGGERVHHSHTVCPPARKSSHTPCGCGVRVRPIHARGSWPQRPPPPLHLPVWAQPPWHLPHPPFALPPCAMQKSTLRYKCLPLSAAIMAFIESTRHYFCTAHGDNAPHNTASGRARACSQTARGQPPWSGCGAYGLWPCARLLTDCALGETPLTPIPGFPQTPSPFIFACPLGITRRYGASAPPATRPHLPTPPARAVCPLASRAGFCISPRAPPAFLPRFARATVSSSGGLTLRCHSACYRLHRPAYPLFAVSASRPRAGAETAKNGRFCITHSGSFLKLC